METEMSLGGLFRWLRRTGEPDRPSIGRYGEDLACRYLARQGYIIRERGARSRLGEIDVVAEEGGDLVFLEVKARRGARFGAPFEAVHGRKQRKLAALAQSYVKRHRLSEVPARFDVVSVEIGRDGAARVSLIRGAFELPCSRV